MVLRGVQFQRSGHVGRAFLIRRVLLSLTGVFGHGRCESVSLPQRNRITRRSLSDSTEGQYFQSPQRTRASYGASG